MIDKITYLETDLEKYPLAFTLNVMESIQNEYGSLSNWSELIQNAKEPNIKALKFFITESINEGIDIENETAETKREFLTEKQVGRIITELGIEKMTEKVQETVIDSTKNENEEEKNV